MPSVLRARACFGLICPLTKKKISPQLTYHHQMCRCTTYQNFPKQHLFECFIKQCTETNQLLPTSHGTYTMHTQFNTEATTKLHPPTRTTVTPSYAAPKKKTTEKPPVGEICRVKGVILSCFFGERSRGCSPPS